MANSNKNGSTEPRPVFRPEDVTIRGYVPRPRSNARRTRRLLADPSSQ